MILRAAGDTEGFQGTLACSDLGFEMLPLSADWGTGAKMGAISRNGGPGQRWRQEELGDAWEERNGETRLEMNGKGNQLTVTQLTAACLVQRASQEGGCAV